MQITSSKKPLNDEKQRKTYSSRKPEINMFYLIMLVWLILIMFGVAWQGNASKKTQRDELEWEYVNGTIITRHKTTVTIDNYFPLQSDVYIPSFYEYEYVDGASSFQRIYNSEVEMKRENITIAFVEITTKYGEDDVAPPDREVNPPVLTGIKPVGMSVTTITVNWSCQKNQTEGLYGPANIALVYRMWADEEISVPSGIERAYSISLTIGPYLLLALFGFLLSRLVFRKEQKVKNAYNYLSGDFDLPENEKRVTCDLLKRLKLLNYFPKQVGTLKKISFGLSILLFKNSINNMIKGYQESFAFEDKKALEKSFARFSVESQSKLSDILPGRQLLAIVIGFLGSIGISFSWNIGAAAPFLYSLGLCYFFLNTGSTFYFYEKYRDRLRLTVLLIAGILLILFPFILSMLRT